MKSKNIYTLASKKHYSFAQRSSVLKFLPLYHHRAAFSVYRQYSGENARERTNFGRRPKQLSRWLEYSLNINIMFILHK